MPRHLLTTTAAFVLAAAASAQTVEISGEVLVGLTYVGAANAFDGPYLNSNDMIIKFSGTGGGWDYEVETEFNTIPRLVKLANETLGTFEIRLDEIVWRKNLLGDTLLLSTYFHSQDIVDTLTIGLEGTAAGVSYEAEIANNATRNFHLELELPFMGVELAASATGNLADTVTLDYGLQAGFDAFGLETEVAWDNNGNIDVDAYAGPFYVASHLSDGDFFDDLTVGYNQDITEQMAVEATVTMTGSSTEASTALTLRF